jgi:glycosyltransferase involved in cell wall biosynthesis
MDHTFQSNTKYEKKNQILIPFSNLHSQFIYNLANTIINKNLTDRVIIVKPAFLSDASSSLNAGVLVVRNRISDIDNERYYKESKLSIYLSEYDGFGIAPLESMWYGTPVIYNDIPCILETSGKGGIVCKLDIPIIIKKIQELIENKSIYISTIKQ